MKRLDLFHTTDEIRKLIDENPNLPFVVFAGRDACCYEWDSCLCTRVSAHIGEFLDCEQDINPERCYDDREYFEDDLRYEYESSDECENMDDAEFVIGLGDAFTAGVNCHIAVPSSMWKTAGKNNVKHSKTADTISIERINILKSNLDGFFTTEHKIGDSIQKDEILAHINEVAVKSPVKGLIRSILRNKTAITSGTKIAEIDTQSSTVSAGIREKWIPVAEKVLSEVDRFIEDV